MLELRRQENIIFGNHGSSSSYKIFFGVVLLLWTLAAGLLLYWSLQKRDEGIVDSARMYATTITELDILYRRWNAMHGGLYAPVSDNLSPNLYLTVPDRDVETTTGQKLTKINPAYMTRQVSEMGSKESIIVGDITSLKPLRPQNRADDWEISALKELEKGHADVSSVQIINGEKILRRMVPLLTEKNCLKCHSGQGYKVGDIRGGISVKVPLAPLIAGDLQGRRILISAIGLAWLLGCFVIYGVARIKKAEIKARANEKKYRTLIETMSEGIIILDGESDIIFCNAPFANMLGYEPDELRHTSLQVYLDADSCGEYTRKVEAITSGHQGSFELNLLKRSGGQVTILFSPRILRSDSYEAVGLLAVTTDISSLKKMEKEMLRQQRLSSVGMLAGGVAHEISGPLQFLEVNSNFLRRAFDSFNEFMHDQKVLLKLGESTSAFEARLKQHEITKMIQEIPNVLDENEKSILRISDIATSIKELARTGPVHPEPEDINSLVRQCIEITRGSWSSVAEMDADLASDPLLLNCISRDINQVLITIIMNAVDSIELMRAGKQSSDKGTIRIATGRVGGELRIVVSDNGIGISHDDLPRIFEPFFTTKKPGKGTGQGLAVAQRIINEHDGDISAESYSSRGAVFIISLPLGL
ncbi:ATP-binding protein [Maridesulfovibrio hydrothermalis]|uniref:histidine kinase n=1 Tax=Maridesulfovibrio hydrothermalis AM13 = DSM 14728 TaxID=1121451 RepID=L0RFB7_9BACT|nr:ATP-binding protein [Maridesulfovibrio hydrothermalis]CCO25478.1 putative PAS/PAC sensor signal transduction histidine kinase [Maridesulfovibrio hydrothermalis AM13 = DSM 14728]